MKKFQSRWIVGLPALLALTACQTPQKNEPAMKIVPTSRVSHGIQEATASYAVGRYYQGQIRYDQAIDAYRKTIALEPGHAEAHNALGLIFSAQGKQDAAIREFEQAVAAMPDSARLRNNLGYALLRRGDTQAAIATFEGAREIAPGNPRIEENLQLAHAQLDHDQHAKPVGEMASLSAPTRPSIPLEPPGETPISDAGRVKAASGIRIEIANGNGVTGLAKRMSAMFSGAGVATARLTNRKPFDVPQTEIQYRPGHEADAQSLTRHLPGEPALVSTTQLRPDIQVRLLLGHDVRRVPEPAQGPESHAPTAASAKTESATSSNG